MVLQQQTLVGVRVCFVGTREWWVTSMVWGYINNNICHGLCRRRVSDERGKWRAPLPSSYNHIMNESYLRIVFDVGMIGSVDCPQKSTHGSTYST